MTENEEVRVSTRLGVVKGNILLSCYGVPIYTFQGIPYAKPPIGDLRFADPVPAEPWSEILDATNAPKKPVCFSLNGSGQAEGTEEDCLYLNLYTPKAPAEGDEIPVMVWFQGGGFLYGNGNRDEYGPDYLVPHGVIMVSVNYRLGIFGFLNLEIEECPGNYGLKDQTMALRWVQENISAFGGNPNNVTIFGQGAGGASVQYQVLSPLARGLFHKAISQSGSALNAWCFCKNPKLEAVILATNMGFITEDSKELLKFFRLIPSRVLMLNCTRFFKKNQEDISSTVISSSKFLPSVEPVGTPNPFLTKTPEQALKDGDYADVPYIHGSTSREMIQCLPSPLLDEQIVTNYKV